MSNAKTLAVRCSSCSTVMHYNNIGRHYKRFHPEAVENRCEQVDAKYLRRRQKSKTEIRDALNKIPAVKKPVASKRVVALAPLTARDVTCVVWEHVRGVGAPVPLELLDKVLAFTQSTHEFMEAIKP